MTTRGTGSWPSPATSCSTRCRSTILCTCSTARAPPASRRRSCTATVGSRSSTRRRSQLHHDLGEGDRFAWFTTTGWMMWNYLVSGLLVGTTLVLFDGDPGSPDLGTLWRLAADTDLDVLGVSASFLMTCRKAELVPPPHQLRSVGSTASPLPAEGFRWVHDAVGADVQVASMSGGTDVCAAFVGASPLLPGARRGDQRASPRLCGRRVRRGRQGVPARCAGRAGAHRADAVDAGRVLERRRRGQAACRLLLRLPGGVAPRRLGHVLRGRRLRHLGPVRRHAQPRRCPARHERLLRGRRGSARGHRQPGRLPRRW